MKKQKESSMMARGVRVLAGAAVAVVGWSLSGWAQQLTDCNPATASCIQVTVGSPPDTYRPGDVVTVPIDFAQGADDGQPGGVDAIAAVAFSLNITRNMELAMCTLEGQTCETAGEDSDLRKRGLTDAIRPGPSFSNYDVRVENTCCDTGSSKPCLCPGPGQQRANHVNIVAFGPRVENIQPGVSIPTLPSDKLLDIDLKVASGASGDVRLHIFNEVSDTTKPDFTAFLSVGDTEAVDQTACRGTEFDTPDCQARGVNSSKVHVTDGVVRVEGRPCVGDCDRNGEVSLGEVQRAFNIFLGTAALETCAAADGNNDGEVTLGEVQVAFNNFLNGCPSIQ